MSSSCTPLITFISERFQSHAALPRSVRAMRIVSIAGLAVAVAALTVASAIGRGFEQSYTKALTGFNAHVVLMGTSSMDDVDELKRVLEELGAEKGRPLQGRVTGLSPFLYREGLALGKGRIFGVVIKGIDPKGFGAVSGARLRLTADVPTLAEPFQRKGRDAYPVIVGRSLAEKLGGPASFRLMIPGSEAEGASRHRLVEAVVVGTFASGMHDFDTQFLMMPMQAVRQLFGTDADAITGVEIDLDDPMDAGAMARAIEGAMGPPYQLITWDQLNSELLSAVRLERLLLLIVMSLMVVVAALNIIACLTLMTIRRYREVSIFKSLGIPDRVIGGLLVRAGLRIGLWGIAVGMAIGVAISLIIKYVDVVPLAPEIYLVDRLPIDISPMICGTLALFCLGVVWLSSQVAARKLVRAPIIEGLHR